MSVEAELARLSPDKDMLLTIGVFDGVHLGHKYLISQLVEQSRQQDLLSGVVTFHQHPQEVLTAEVKLPFLTDLAERSRLLKNEGVGVIIPLSFTSELARLGARRFVSLLKKHLRMRGLVIGHDFALGQNREGNADTLRRLGQEMEFSVTVVPPMTINGEVASSTAIREALNAGDMERVCAMAGRPFSLHGQVTSGTGRGVELGFPTANLDIDPEQAVPADGVYATWGYINGKAYQSMTYIGKAPTFGGSKRSVEVYVLDYSNDLYGRELKIDIIDKLRGDRQFDTAEELKKQIAEDVERGKAILSSKAEAKYGNQ